MRCLLLLVCFTAVAEAKPGPDPCFAGKPPILAHQMAKDLSRYAWSVYDNDDVPPPPPTKYGTCKVERNQVTSARGKLVAELGCGVRVLVPGIRDGLGLEVGSAKGSDVLARTKRDKSRLICVANGPDQVRCRLARTESEQDDPDTYVVDGKLGEEVLTGEAARAYFAPKPLVEIGVSIFCH